MTDAAPATKTPATRSKGKVEAFTFGEAESVLDRRELLEHIECWRNGKWYEPPISLKSLARVMNAGSHHRSAIVLKKNLLAESFIPTNLLSRADFEQLALDYLAVANCYVERVDNMMGRPMALKRSMAMYTRRGVEADQFYYVNNRFQAHEFAKGSILQIMEYDLSQEIYGLPEYLGALQSLLLNEAATLFRRRYYLNGAHAGFVFYLSESTLAVKDVDAIREQIRKAKGVGNFKNLFLHVPNGKKDGVQIVPMSEAAAKDEFLGIKNTTRDDVLAAHRVPPQLLGIVPANSGGFGDIGKARDVFFENEIKPLQSKFLQINDWLGVEAVVFKEFQPVGGAGA
ncbi:phage portal protein [Asticcacaulis machinosus]|uniref:Phage portal protein n=1 Tax=Asticcacaulis machinosus TaxID=2984211 RepID=A0ABT5HGH9_9CAUL|nr:phage portal protein [Asticcacaulis machinosus]MDC7675365.1 phage portal protein [Asticcacaulis machinosus]